LKGVRSGVERRRGVSGLKAGGGRRETTAKVLKKRRSPRERGRMGTSVRDAPGSSISGITGTGGRDAGSDFNALTGSTNSIPCATAVGYGVTHDRGDASAVSIAFPVAGSCGMDVHFPEAPSNVQPWYPHSGSFHTKRWRGGVERRQMELKGIEVGD
jgi:hypothetical protein